MALIETSGVNQSSQEFWEDELKNSRVLLEDINRRIHALEIENYSLDTGQNNQSVHRSSLQSLLEARKNLLEEIADLEEKLGLAIAETGQLVQVVPF